jgi:hypothetical protein
MHECAESGTERCGEPEPIGFDAGSDDVRGSAAPASATEPCEVETEKKKRKKKRKLALVSRKFIAAWIVIFVTLQPALTKAVFGLFACRKLEDDTKWVLRDLQVGCYSPTHMRWLFAVGIPGAVLYPVGIPLGAAFILYSHRNDLETRPVKKKFGFLYSGFHPKYYVWESGASPPRPPRRCASSGHLHAVCCS